MQRLKLKVLQIQKFELVIYLQCGRDITRQRFLNRKLPGRVHQDDEAMFNKRFKEHEEETPAILQHYDSVGVLVNVRLNGGGQASLLTLKGRFEWGTRINVQKAFGCLERRRSVREPGKVK